MYEKDGEVIAYCYYGKRNDLSYKEYEGEVFALYVKNECQQKGIGTALLQEAMKALSNEHKKIMLWCAKENYKAISFYKKNGLKIIGEDLENIGIETLGLPSVDITVNSIERQNLHYRPASECAKQIEDFLKLYNIEYSDDMIV